MYIILFSFLFNETTTSDIYTYVPTLSLHDALPLWMSAIASMDFDGFGVDIESRDVADVPERNRRLLDISARLDAALGGRPLAAIVMEPVIMEDVNPDRKSTRLNSSHSCAVRMPSAA